MIEVDIAERISYGACQIEGSDREDRGCCRVNHEEEGQLGVASFGVFDGHGGNISASACSQLMHSGVLTRFSKLSSALMDVPRDLADKYSSINVISNTDKLNNNLRACDTSGTTALSLFLLHNTDDDTIRAVCSNIGNSRCVLYGCDIEAIIPFDESFSCSQRQYMGDDSDSGSSKNQWSVRSATHPNRKSRHAPINIYEMSEDHNQELLRERSRVLGKIRLESDKAWMTRPASVWVALPASVVATADNGYTFASVTFELGYPSRPRLDVANDMIGLLSAVASNISPQKVSYQFANEEAKDPDAAKKKKMYIDDKGMVQNAQLMPDITRSIGDRFGPKSCVAVPEISATTIEAHEFGRFVLASKGMWNVISNRRARNASLRFADPQALATHLATKAREVYGQDGIEAPDICVIVVDVNPRNLRKYYTKLKSNKQADLCCAVV